MKNKKYWKLVVYLTLIFVLVGTYEAVYGFRLKGDKLYKVDSVIDGDTIRIKINWKKATVRFLGINTPETVDPRKKTECYGISSSMKTKELLFDKKIYLEFEKDRERKDRYGRFLAYVKREDGLDINEYLIMNGYAAEYTFGSPYSRQRLFRALENKARKSQLGLWGECS